MGRHIRVAHLTTSTHCLKHFKKSWTTAFLSTFFLAIMSLMPLQRGAGRFRDPTPDQTGYELQFTFRELRRKGNHIVKFDF